MRIDNSPAFAMLLTVLALVSPPDARSAAGTVDLSFGGCSPVVASVDSVAQGGQISIYASVTGHGEPHSGAGVEIIYGDWTTGSVPDAWRFDAAGCMGPNERTVDLLATPEVASSCPSFDPRPLELQQAIFGFVPPSSPYPPGLMRIYVSNQHVSMNETQVDPGQRYFLARIRFYLTKAVDGIATAPGTCGGLDRPACFFLSRAVYASYGQIVHNFDLGNRVLSVRGPCDEQSPARATTWGQIRNQYRR